MSSSPPSRWKAVGKNELRKLASDDSWCLPTTIAASGASLDRSIRSTRMKSRAVRVPDEVDTAVSPSNMSTLSASIGTPSSKQSAGDTRKKYSRVILDVDHVKGTMESYMSPCPLCKAKLFVGFPSVCLATSIRIQCTNPICTFVDVQKPPSKANIALGENSSSNKERNTDYAVNVLFILGFLTSGDGGKEASKILGLLGLPNSSTVEKRSWPTIERSISDTIERVSEEIINENLHMAVENFYGDKRNENGDKLFDRWKAHDLLEDDEKPSLTVSADMGWQGRSSGVQYNSASGHATLVEQETRLVIALNIKSKICNVCTWYERNDRAVRDHKCVRNHEAGLSSGAMEPVAILEMCVDTYNNNNTIIETIVTDDDSSIKAKLKWSNADYMINKKTDERPTHQTKGGKVVPRPDRGGLPGYIPEPSFLADPNHRKKTLKGALYGILKKKKADRHGLMKVDVIRITNNFAYMMRGLHELPSTDQFVEAGKAVLNHHFDIHDHCSESFCRRKTMTQEERDAEDKIYRCKTKDAKLYSFLEEVLSRFLTQDALMEVGHAFDTQVNESLNNSIAWLAPKNKTYAGSRSLANRIYITIGIQSIGSLHYFKRLFDALGIDVTPDVLHYLTQHAETRDFRITKGQDKETKRLRNKKLHDKLKAATMELKGAVAKRDGCIYERGIGLGGGYATDGEDSFAPVPSPAKKRRVASTATRKCSACGLPGHNRSNRMCTLWKPSGAVKFAASTTTRDLEEQHLLDQLNFAADQDLEEDADADSGALAALV